MSHKIEIELIKYIQELRDTNKLGWFPYYMYDYLEENIPHNLVVKLGEIIINNKGVGNDKMGKEKR